MSIIMKNYATKFITTTKRQSHNFVIPNCQIKKNNHYGCILKSFISNSMWESVHNNYFSFLKSDPSFTLINQISKLVF